MDRQTGRDTLPQHSPRYAYAITRRAVKMVQARAIFTIADQ